jgi:hypothetical protein
MKKQPKPRAGKVKSKAARTARTGSADIAKRENATVFHPRVEATRTTKTTYLRS